METAARRLNAAPETAARNASNAEARAKQRIILSNAAYAMAKQNGTLPPGAVSVRQVHQELHGSANVLEIADFNRAATLAPARTIGTSSTPIKAGTKAGNAKAKPSKPLTLAQRVRALSPTAKAKLAQVLASVRNGGMQPV